MISSRIRTRLILGTALIVLVAGVTHACKGFLDTHAQGTLDEDALATRAGVEGTLVAAYRSLDCSSSSAGSWGCAASNWGWASVTSDDAYYGSNLGDYSPLLLIETYLWGGYAIDDYLNQKWSQVYEGVSRANATLRLLAKVRAEQLGEISDVDAAGIRGEAVFLRAHYHFEAYRMWAKIPYYYETDADFRKANNLSPDSIVRLIIADLDTAIVLLPATPRGGDRGRASAWTARAYKGRVEVYGAATTPALWDSALVTLRAVRADGPYALEPSFDHVWTGFTQYENGPETILAFQASVNDGEPSGWNSNWGERLNFPHQGSHFGCCGFHQPSQNLVNFFAVDAAGLPRAVSDSNWNALDTNFAAGSPTPVDPRLDWTVGRDGVPYKDWGPHERSWIRDQSYGGPYSPKKNAHEKASGSEGTAGWQPSQTNGVNIHLLRYADLLLLLAEAEVEAGLLENARAIVNEIRARAGAKAQGPGTVAESIAVPLTQVGTVYALTEPWATYRIGLYPGPWTDQAFARAAVHTERRLELAMEGQRFFDLRRWGVAESVLNDYIAVEKTRRLFLTLATPFSARHARYPIPDIQIDLSKVGSEERLVQNPGW